jgi:pimeloyl-ACP methyl ester carboxylesterase
MSAATVEAAGVALAVEERGSGDPVVFVHGTATGRAVWRETLNALGDGVRGIVYDRRAYGESGAPEPYGGTTVGEQADDLAQLIRALDAAPALLVGHELGALAALDLLLREPALARGAVLIEPSMLWLSPAGTDAMSALRDVVERAAIDGGGAAAVAAFLEVVDGPPALELLGPERLAAAQAAPRAFAADLAAAATWPATRRELRGIEAPVTVVSGDRSSPVRREAARALAELLPGAELVTVPAGHLAHVEAPAEIARQIALLAAGRGQRADV